MIPPSIVPLPRNRTVVERVRQLELPFNHHGIDPFGIDQRELAGFFTVLGWLYRNYFSVQVYGADHVPARGRAMLVGNHSGGFALDGLMVIASSFFELNPPRLAQGMVEKFMARFPFANLFASRIGQFTGLPQHAARLLEEDRLLMVFPEGVRGTAKLFTQRDSLVNFGTGFVRLALQTGAPIVPVAFVGGGEAIPTVANLYGLGKMFGVPYIPVTPYGLPVPLPVSLQILYGEPIVLEGSATDTDEVIGGHVSLVKNRIAKLLGAGRDLREGRISVQELDLS